VTDIIVKAVSLVLIVALGWGAKRLGWLEARHFTLLSVIVLRITLPCALITSFNTVTITRTLLWLIVFGFSVNIVQQVTAWLLTRHASPARRSLDILHGGSYNIGAFAMPYVSQFVGPVAMVQTAMFDIGNSISAGGIGYGWGLAVSRRGRTPTGSATTVVEPVETTTATDTSSTVVEPVETTTPATDMVSPGSAGKDAVSARTRLLIPLRFVASMLRSPVFDTYLVLLTLRLADLTLPAPVITFTSLVGAANPFLAMFMLGVGLEFTMPRAKYRVAAVLLARRYAFVAAFSLLAWFVLPFPADIRLVCLMVLWAPVAVMVAGFTAEAGADVEVASFVASCSIVIAIVMMPAVYLLAQ